MPSTPRLTTATVAARIPYANAAPFYALWKDAPFAVRNLVPRELGREAESGGVDLGLMATGDYLRLKDRFEPLSPPMGVATRGAVYSVLLFSRRPAGSLAGASISVTPETSTSIRLLRLLLDVREDHEWDGGRLPGSLHLSKGVIERDIEKHFPDRSTSIVCYCGGGYRSVLVCENLQRMGYRDVRSLAGGYRGWIAAGLPVETDETE